MKRPMKCINRKWWCGTCGGYVTTIIDQWETSKAVVRDRLCRNCGNFGARKFRLKELLDAMEVK